MRKVATEAGLGIEDLAGTYVHKEYRTAHNGVTHLVFRQQFQGIDVYNAEFTVNIDSEGRVVNSGGQLYTSPGNDIAAPGESTAAPALHAAIRAVRPNAAIGYLATGKPGQNNKQTRFARAGLADPVDGQPVWYGINGVLRPAWVFYVDGENGIDRYATVVDNDIQKVLAQDNLTFYQKPPTGLVFEKESPQPETKVGSPGTEARPYVQRTTQGFDGDKAASPMGWVRGATTAGNNVIAGQNLMGATFLPNARSPLAVNGEFSFPLQLGTDAPNPVNYWEAATTNLFYWANKAHDFFYQIGFDEAAGNFQQQNVTGQGADGDPMLAYSHFGAANPGSVAALNNAFFTFKPNAEDGSQASINMYIGGDRQTGVFADGSYDAGVIVHEYTHGVSNRLVRQLGGAHGGAMGEAWSDFFSLEFLIPEGAPLDGAYPVGEYLFQSFGTGIRTRPYSCNMDINPLTFAAMGRVSSGGPEVHADGEIWANALWELRCGLIGQFGETEGRRRVRLLVLDGMKLSAPSPTMVEMRDAILLADRVGFKGASQKQIWETFARRGLGVFAWAGDSNTVHILASYETPSTVGSLRFTENQYTLGETVRILLQDANNTADTAKVQFTSSSGDLETVILRRDGSIFAGTLPTRTSIVAKGNGYLEVIPADSISAYYIDADAGGQPKLIEATAPTAPVYTLVTSTAGPFVSGPESPMMSLSGRITGTGSIAVNLPFEFPFFDRKYSRMWVNQTGIVTFDMPPNVSGCYDRSALARSTAIAPLWLDLAYGGTAQPNENVYLSTAPDSVTVRWAAETQPYLSSYVTPAPVNFRVTLFKDGRIQTQYGAGNQNLTDTWAFVSAGCAASAPVIGISNGHETYTQMSPYDSAPALENARTMRFDPPFGFTTTPVAIVESPAVGETVKGVLTVKGVAYDDTNFVTRLDVLIDDVMVGQTSPSISRTDFCNGNKVPGCPSIGFQLLFNVDTLNLAPGTHLLKIRATNSRGAVVDFPGAGPLAFTVEAGQSRLPAGAIESPAEGAELSGTTQIKGYAYAKDLRVVSIDIIIDGVSYGPASYNQRRDDVCTSTAISLNCPNVGFTFNLNTRSASPWLSNGAHALQIRVRDELGRFTMFPESPVNITVNNAANQLPAGVVVSPENGATLSGVVTVAGYAWDPDGKVSSVSILLDGTTVATAKYGLPQPEACATLPDVTACPNIGFEGTFDSKRYSNGVHTLGIGVLDDKGGSKVFPAFVRYGMNVVIQN